MCLTCGCMEAHRVMGDNVTYEDLKRMADGNGKTVEETLGIIEQTVKIDRNDHQSEYTRASTSEAEPRRSGIGSEGTAERL